MKQASRHYNSRRRTFSFNAFLSYVKTPTKWDYSIKRRGRLGRPL